jgi:hypothetical protein
MTLGISDVARCWFAYLLVVFGSNSSKLGLNKVPSSVMVYLKNGQAGVLETWGIEMLWNIIGVMQLNGEEAVGW